jgi:hypothetical protein
MKPHSSVMLHVFCIKITLNRFKIDYDEGSREWMKIMGLFTMNVLRKRVKVGVRKFVVRLREEKMNEEKCLECGERGSSDHGCKTSFVNSSFSEKSENLFFRFIVT